MLPASIGDFSSDQVIEECDEFADIIQNDVSAKAWIKIIAGAKEFVPAGPRRSNVRPKASTSAPVQKRAVMRKDSDDESV